MDLTTERLVLRPMVQADAPALFEILSDAQAMRFWHRPAVTRLAVVDEMVREQIAAHDICRYWTAWRDGDAIGSCDLSLIDPQAGRAQTGFLFRRDQWGHGYGFEAMAAVTAHAFDGLNLDLLIAHTDVKNAPARRVLEKLGFGLEHILPGHEPVPGRRMDCAVYALRRPIFERRISSAQNGA